jgi:hypothetical protein
MNIETARSVLLWCTIINYAMVVLWFVLITLGRNWIYPLWGRWFRLTPEQFDQLNFIGIALYKVGVLLFNLVPWIALTIVR